ncbi:MAG: hypothetical protein AAF968_12585 [Pseudomonadota bacterium]
MAPATANSDTVDREAMHNPIQKTEIGCRRSMSALKLIDPAQKSVLRDLLGDETTLDYASRSAN